MSKHTLILLRHGKSDWSGDEADFDRLLNKRGEESVPKMGAWLKQHGPVPERVIASPAERAWRTATLMAQALGLDESVIVLDERIYEAGLPDLKSVIDERCTDTNCAMLVGHNPGLDQLLMHLSASPPPRNETGKLMTTAAMAILDYGLRSVSSATGSAELKELKRPRELPG